MSASEKRMVTVTIDDKPVQVEEGSPLILAAEKLGKHIPRFCYHEHLSVAGNCRMCAVEVEGVRGLPISCATPCSEGLVARTDTEKVASHRSSVMEFLLINHPIDCPICDQAGECALQIYYMDHDLRDSRLDVDKVEYGKRIPVGPRVVLDQDRCVECTRCIRFCDEVTGTGELRMMNRGDREVIDVFPGVPLDNPYSVNTADICPVGALTDRDFRFRVRPWFLQHTKSICPGCSRGCNVNVYYGWHPIVPDYNGKAYRIKPRVNNDVNQAWMCDFGRLEYRRVNEGRVTETRVDGAPVPLSRGIERARRALAEAGEDALLVVSLESTLEEMFLLARMAAESGAAVAAVPDRADGFEDDLLIRADKHPNRAGARMLGILREASDLPALLAGRKAVLVHRADILGPDGSGVAGEAFRSVPVRISIAANESETSSAATILLPGCSYIEKTGHWVNFQGRIQRIYAGARMPVLEGAADDLAVLWDLLGERGEVRVRQVFEGMTRAVAELSGVQWDAIGDGGAVPAGEGQESLRR